MSSHRSVEELAAAVASNTAKYSEALKAMGIPSPSHDPIPHLPSAPPPLPAEAETARREAELAAYELHRLLLGPVELYFNAAANAAEVLGLDFVIQNKVYQKFAPTETITYKALAEACKLDEDDTRHIMRLAIANNLFQEKEPNTISHTLASQMLLVNPLMAAWAGNLTDEIWRGMPLVVDNLRKYPGSQDPLQTAYCRFNGFTTDPWKEWAKFPGRVERFADTMRFMQSDPASSPQFLIEYGQFERLSGVVVDVGGSTGTLGIALAKAFPNLHLIVQDSAETIAARPPLEVQLQGRVQFMAHDFFSEQPVKDADVYVFRWIFHDWSDEYSIRILRQLVPALKHGARIVIYDSCVPPPGLIPIEQDRMLRSIDMTMKTISNGKERDAKEWEHLFAMTDPRFHFKGITAPPGARLAIIDAVWMPAA